MAILTLKGLYFTPFQSSLWFRITLVTIKIVFLLLLLFCLNWEYVCIVKTNGVGKELSIANVFHSSNIWFHSSGVWRTTSEEKIFSHMHIHTHIFECPRIFALNSSYIKCNCGTHPGKLWSIQLLWSVAGSFGATPAELFWNKGTVSKYSY